MTDHVLISGGGIAGTATALALRTAGIDATVLEGRPAEHGGGAAHVAPPASEQGAAIAVEDGVCLAQCLRDLPDPERAFAAFERLRRERVEAVVVLGQRGTRGAHRSRPARLRNDVRARVAGWTAWQRRPATGGPAWAFEHHIDWDRTVGS